jgi:hypothetical protein
VETEKLKTLSDICYYPQVETEKLKTLTHDLEALDRVTKRNRK